MIKGIGVDIVDLTRIKVENDNFAIKILTEKEFEIYQSKKSFQHKKEFLGGRFAAKEAFLKAKGKGIGEIGFKDIEILCLATGQPYLNFSNTFISISHEKNMAIAYVIIEEGC